MSDDLASGRDRERRSGLTRERAMLMLEQRLHGGESLAKASETVAAWLGCSGSSVARWWRADRAKAKALVVSAREQELTALHREVSELREANRLLRAACEAAWLQIAQAKGDR